MSAVGTVGRQRRYWILLLVTTFIIALDQWTKALILSRYMLGESLSLVTDFFSITYIRNTGAAFGILATADPRFRIPFFVIVPLVALAAIGFIFRKLPAHDVKMSTALSLVIGGAVGNLLDRVRLGYVVDFLDFHWGYAYHFPAFNVADSAICVGVGLLMVDLMVAEREEARPHASASS